jgi:hypothetical protein
MLSSNDDIVITDVRFPNEIKAIKQAGGRVFRIKRGPEPEWYEDALSYNQGPTNMSWALSKMRLDRDKIHASETAWIGQSLDADVDNNGSIDDLFFQLKNLVQDLPVAK